MVIGYLLCTLYVIIIVSLLSSTPVRPCLSDCVVRRSIAGKMNDENSRTAPDGSAGKFLHAFVGASLRRNATTAKVKGHVAINIHD